MKTRLTSTLLGGVIGLCAILAAGAVSSQARGPADASRLPGGQPIPPFVYPTVPEPDKPEPDINLDVPPTNSGREAIPECEVAQTQCAARACYPLSSAWRSHRSCIAQECHVEKQGCLEELVKALKERRRRGVEVK